ncbi:MAG: 6,7-dimethyl-8-ribityllumazine synthase [Thermoanaerobaculia bacterium]
MRSFEGDVHGEGLRIAVVASRFNDEIVEGLLQGALTSLRSHGVDDDAVSLVRVPGAFEIPAAVMAVVRTGNVDAIISIGCLIRGDTPHFDFLAAQVTAELSRIAVDTQIPVAFGVITCNTMEQAIARSSSGGGNKGWEAALAAIEMATLFRALHAKNDRLQKPPVPIATLGTKKG